MAAILSRPQCVNPAGGGTGIFRDEMVNTMTADALVTSNARSSAAIVLTMRNKQVLIFHGGEFQ